MDNSDSKGGPHKVLRHGKDLVPHRQALVGGLLHGQNVHVVGRVGVDENVGRTTTITKIRHQIVLEHGLSGGRVGAPGRQRPDLDDTRHAY